MLSAFVLITVDAGTERQVYDKLKDIKEVEEVNELYGEYDLIVRVSTIDNKKLDYVMSDKIRAIKEVKLTSTMIIAR